jgi:hypothetical protein
VSLTGLVLVVAAVAGLSVAAAAGAGTRPAVPKAAITRTTVKPGAATTAAALPFGSQMIFNNFGPALNAYNPGTGWTVSETGSGTGTLWENANAFTPSVGGQITRIDIALSNYFGTNNATVELVQDNGGLPTGQVLGAWSVAGQAPFGSCCAVTTINTGRLIPVGAGRQYWLVAVPGPNFQNDTWDAWNWTYNNASTGPNMSYEGGVGWIDNTGDPSGAFDIVGCGKVCKVYP